MKIEFEIDDEEVKLYLELLEKTKRQHEIDLKEEALLRKLKIELEESFNEKRELISDLILSGKDVVKEIKDEYIKIGKALVETEEKLRKISLKFVTSSEEDLKIGALSNKIVNDIINQIKKMDEDIGSLVTRAFHYRDYRWQ